MILLVPSPGILSPFNDLKFSGVPLASAYWQRMDYAKRIEATGRVQAKRIADNARAEARRILDLIHNTQLG